ncbi:MAG: alpha/beta hydrolase [Cytophagales bacterium]|jgi:predicted esterase|nr:alpha/beta hydrolase [Cytophagales bacterium]
MIGFINKFFSSIYNFLNPLILYFSCLCSGFSHVNDVMFHIYTDPYEDINCIKNHAGDKLPVPEIVKYYKGFLENKDRKDFDLDDYSVEFLTKNIIDVGPADYRLKAYYKNSAKDCLFVYFYGVGKTMFWTSLTGNPYYTLKTNLQNDFDILIPEYPGYGVNNFKNDRKNLEKMVGVYADWIQENYHGKKIIIGGHSFGCWIALSLTNKLADENVNVILNNPFYNNQTTMLWAVGKKYGETLTKFLTFVEYENDKLIKSLGGKNVNIYITSLKEDKVCAYEDSVRLSKLCDYVHLIDLCDNSKNFKHRIHRYVNHEQNLWISRNILNEKFYFSEADYDLFKNSILKRLKHFF